MEYLPYTCGLIFTGKSREIYQSHGSFGDDSTPHKTPRAHKAELLAYGWHPSGAPGASTGAHGPATFGDGHILWFQLLKYSGIFLRGWRWGGWFTVGCMEFFEAKRFWLRWVWDPMLFGSPMSFDLYGGYIHGVLLYTAKNGHQTWSAKVMEISSSLGFGNSVQHTAREIPEVGTFQFRHDGMRTNED